ncbi:MAG: hypothetical protein HC799_16750 [Limnothrix sp. RL_2_0]|nr:hypothetical protein [Limnothrix sp. RL_2_0]
MTPAIAQQLETYTIKRPNEVLLVHTLAADTEDQILIFKGFSSSLMQPTDFNPDNSVFAPNAELVAVDRLKSPYLPNDPQYIQRDMTWEMMAVLLTDIGIV